MTGLEVRLPKSVDFNNEAAMSAKTRYGVKGSQIIQTIKPTQSFRDLAKMDSISIERKIINSNIFKKKYNEKLKKLKSLLKICYTFTTDLDGDSIERGKKKAGALGYCIFTDHTRIVLKEKYNIDITSSELRRLVSSAADLGFLVPNTYKNKDGIVRKNYRYDLRNPANSYSTSYLVNFQAISAFVGNEIKEETKAYYKEENKIEIVGDIEKEVMKLQAPLINVESKRLFSGVYDSGFLLKEDGNKVLVGDINSRQLSSLRMVLYDIIHILKEEKKLKINEILKDKKYKDILHIIEITNLQDKVSYDTCIDKCVNYIFNYKTKNTFNLLNKLIKEYNDDKTRMNRKEFRAHISKNGVTGRGFSPYCKTSKLLEANDPNSREYWKKENNIKYNIDITSMIPNLSRFLKEGDTFKQEDLYEKMCKEIKKLYGLNTSREDIKQVFLRFKFSKSLPLAISQMKRAEAKNLASEGIYAKMFTNYKTGKTTYWLTEDWYKNNGNTKIEVWTAIYKTIENICGISKDSLIFFWESLLEQIILTNLKRQGITCYNIYDEFFATQKFDLEAELGNASKIVLEAYNGNNESLKNFIRGN